jgi:predicted nucleic acid-binding protein
VTVLIDSDVLVEVSRGHNLSLVSRWHALADSAAAVLYSPITLAELWAGARPAEHPILRKLFSALRCMEIEEQTAYRAGQFLRQFSKSHGLKIADALIAAGAVTHSAQLWTRNRKHYPMEELSFFD